MFANPIGLFALLGIPIVLGLHLYRRRFRSRRVSALFLWMDQDESSVAGRKRERLRTSASMWLELLAALIFALVLAGPRACNAEADAHLVVVIDGSASMGTRGNASSAKERATELIARRLKDLGTGTRVTMIVSGREPRILAGPAERAPLALEALDAFFPEAPQHDFAPALTLAHEFSGGKGVLFVTDKLLEQPLLDWVELRAVGQARDNAGIVRAFRTRADSSDGNAEQVFLTLQAFSSQPLTRTLLIEGPTQELIRREVTLAPDLPKNLKFSLPDGCGVIRARFEAADSLEIDDAVSLAPEPIRVLRLATTLKPQVARQLGLASQDGPINRLSDALSDTQAVDQIERADLIISDAPVSKSDAWILQLHSASPTSSSASSSTDSALDPTDRRRDYVGPFLSERRHPLLRGTTFEGIVWSIDPQVALPGAPLVTIGDLPILTEESSGERRLIHLNLLPTHSTLARSPDWAILLSNLAELRRASLPGPESVNLVAGEEFLFHGAPPGDYVVRNGNGLRQELLVTEGLLRVENLQAPGLYQILPSGPRLDGQASEALTSFCVQFQDAAESDLRGLDSGNQGKGLALGEVPSLATPFETLAGCLIVLLLLADWWVLGRDDRRELGSPLAKTRIHRAERLGLHGKEAGR